MMTQNPPKNSRSTQPKDQLNYASLEMTPVINAAGTLTSLGGCRTRPEAISAMAAAADQFIPFEALQKKVGAHLANLLGVPAALVTAGAAPGLTLAAAACMVGGDISSASRLPGPPKKNKIIIQCTHRGPFERAILLAGADLVQVGDAIHTRLVDLESAIDEQTAALVFFLQAEMYRASLSLSDTLEIARAHGLPVIVDAAAELPPKRNLWELSKRGADLVVFSGGKDLRGPQASGLLVGREDLIASALMQSAPHEHVAGRALKPGKGSILGLTAALEAYLEEDEAARFDEWEKIAILLEDGLGALSGVRAGRFVPTQPQIRPACTPRVAISLDESLSLTTLKLKEILWGGLPPIAAEIIQGQLILNTHTLTIPEAEIIAGRITECLQ